MATMLDYLLDEVRGGGFSPARGGLPIRTDPLSAATNATPGFRFGLTSPTTGRFNVSNTTGLPVGGASGSSFGTSPFSQPRGIPPLTTTSFDKLQDAQYAKFSPGQNPYVDSLRQQQQISVNTPVSKEHYATLAAGGGELKWDATHQQWYIAGGNAPNPNARGGPNYGSRPDLYPSVQQYQDRYQSALDYLNGIGTHPVGTPALQQLLGNRQTAPRQQQAPWRWG